MVDRVKLKAVEDFMTEHGVRGYFKALISQGVDDLETLCACCQTDLQSMGLPLVAAKKLMTAIVAHNQRANATCETQGMPAPPIMSVAVHLPVPEPAKPRAETPVSASPSPAPAPALATPEAVQVELPPIPVPVAQAPGLAQAGPEPIEAKEAVAVQELEQRLRLEQLRTHLQHFLASAGRVARRLVLTPKRLFISYAWDADAAVTRGLQTTLNRIKLDFAWVFGQLRECSVFLDCSGDMVGDMREKMETEINRATHVLVIVTKRAKARAEDPEPNNLQFEYSLIANRGIQQPNFVLSLQLETGGGFPGCLALAYPHHKCSDDGCLPLTCLPLTQTPLFDFTSEAGYFRSMVGLVEQVMPEIKADPRYILTRQIYTYRMCQAGLCTCATQACADQDKASPNLSDGHVSDEHVSDGPENGHERALLELADMVRVQARESGVRPRCFLDQPKCKSPEAQERLRLLNVFLAQAGADVVRRPLSDRFGQDPLDRFVLLGLGQRDAEIARLCEKYERQSGKKMLVPAVLDGTWESAFPGLNGVSQIMSSDLSSWPFSSGALRTFVSGVWGFDPDDHPWFALAIELYELRCQGALCRTCRSWTPAPLSWPRDKKADADAAAVEASAGEEEDLKVWEMLKSTFPDQLGKMRLDDFGSVTSKDLEELIQELAPKFAIKGMMRRLHKSRSKQ